MKTVEEKYQRLLSILKEMDSVAVGYSGGVDSTFLAKIAADVLGGNALSVAAISDSFPQHEREEAEKFARNLGLNYITIDTSELDNPDYRKNDPNRCFYCKQELVRRLRAVADEHGVKEIALGTNLDDLGDYRPGQAAAKEGGARFPMVEAEMTKDDIRHLSKQLGIPTWDKPSFACLASRFPYGEEISKEKLERVGQAESVLRELGFRQFRVRSHDNIARIEVLPNEMAKVILLREDITRLIRKAGFAYVAMDLLGYRTGSMNETLHQIRPAVADTKSNT
ncbi:MAG: ATP-dependent sacrificial sulfur transferase LarE [Candidatus Omnitrophota bacterium]|jgi:uncharacterized protein|nr:MAG: ATP-dependent sacrificial sulfur transferase LarE [Candidatus Omnitrophota bacterium]